MGQTTDRIRVGVILGSVREGRFGPVVASWVTRHAEKHPGLDVDLIDLADFSFPAATAAFTDRIAAADTYIVVTPEYNHSYPGPLKHAIDAVGAPWYAKPVAFVSYGGLSGGLRAVEPLRVVFAELHAVTIRDTVSFHGAWNAFDAVGEPHDPAATTATDALLDRLIWWATALREARAARPYAA